VIDEQYAMAMERLVAGLRIVLEPTILCYECPRCSIFLRLQPIQIPHDGEPFCTKCGARTRALDGEKSGEPRRTT